MRDRKYRAWDEKFQVMLYGVGVFNNDNIVIPDVTVNESYGGRLDERLEDLEGGVPEWYLMTGGFKLMEFIDREDIEGVDMYEGDILRTPNKNLFIVEWDDRRSAFVAKCIYDGHLYTFNDSYISYALIIGNIYENPELLEAGLNDQN